MEKYVCQLRRGVKESSTGRDDWAEYETRPTYIKPLKGELVVEYDNGIPRLKIGNGIDNFSELPYMSVDSFILPKHAVVYLDSTLWKQESEGRYSQEVEIQGVQITASSRVDLQPTSDQLGTFHEKDIAFVAQNENGVIMVYCVGQLPQNSYTINATVTEMIIDDNKVVGNTAATPNPQSDWNQTDETKADYIKNKPDYEALIAEIAELRAKIDELIQKNM